MAWLASPLVVLILLVAIIISIVGNVVHLAILILRNTVYGNARGVFSFVSVLLVILFLPIFHRCLLTGRHVCQFPTAAAGMNHLRKANNNFSDGLTNLKWVIFLRKQRMFDASFRPRA